MKLSRTVGLADAVSLAAGAVATLSQVSRLNSLSRPASLDGCMRKCSLLATVSRMPMSGLAADGKLRD